jgi:hypothetical protein
MTSARSLRHNSYLCPTITYKSSELGFSEISFYRRTAAIVDNPVPPLFIGLGTSFLFLAAGYITHHGEAGLSAR